MGAGAAPGGISVLLHCHNSSETTAYQHRFRLRACPYLQLLLTISGSLIPLGWRHAVLMWIIALKHSWLTATPMWGPDLSISSDTYMNSDLTMQPVPDTAAHRLAAPRRFCRHGIYRQLHIQTIAYTKIQSANAKVNWMNRCAVATCKSRLRSSMQPV